MSINIKNQMVKPNFPPLIPAFYSHLIDFTNPLDPLFLMSVPSEKESISRPNELPDPIADAIHEKTPGLIHRYEDRVLLKVTNTCAIHCRFCFRKNILSESTFDLAKAIKYISSHKQIWEVILSGGDPLTLSDERLTEILKQLKKIPHIKVIRFHTRIPVVTPSRITKKFAKNFKNSKQRIVFVIHINHPREITNELTKASRLLASQNIMLLSQSVLLKGVNDNTETLKTLFRNLVQIGIKPYYLHQLDRATGTSHFEIPIKKAIKIYNSLRGSLSGICIPEFMIEQPEGKGKIPVK